MIMSTDMIRCPSLVIEGFMMNNTLVGVVSPTDSIYDLGNGNVTLLNANISFTVILKRYFTKCQHFIYSNPLTI